jgi:hypothetical protein
MSEREAQLLASMKADAAIWERHAASMDHATGGEPTKIDLAKKRGDELARQRKQSARMGSNDRRKTRKIRGTMMLTENRDKLCAPTVECATCGEPFSAIKRGNRPAALFCSKKCAHAAWRIRRVLANG